MVNTNVSTTHWATRPAATPIQMLKQWPSCMLGMLRDSGANTHRSMLLRLSVPTVHASRYVPVCVCVCCLENMLNMTWRAVPEKGMLCCECITVRRTV